MHSITKIRTLFFFLQTILLVQLFTLEDSMSAPLTEEDACGISNGTWVTDGSACAPCLECRTLEGTLREENGTSCDLMCQPTCICPEGTIWYNYDCKALEDISLCSEDREMACTQAGGTWNTCGSSCGPTICVNADGSLQTEMNHDEAGCTAVCFETCDCPDQAWNGTACVDYADFYTACEESDNEMTTAEEDSCQQVQSRTSFLFMALALLFFGLYRRFSFAQA